jgi:lysophospholipase L1-like esterase
VKQILVYGDSMSWGIRPGTRERLPFDRRWPGVMQLALDPSSCDIRIIEDCLNGRRTAWDDPFRPGRNGLQGLAQRIEVNAPLALVILALGTNDFQATHALSPALSAQGIAALVGAIRQAPFEPGMKTPPVLIVAPPPIGEPRSPLAAKFEGAREKSAGLAAAYADIAGQLECPFFDAGSVTASSAVDGIHLDADQHLALGKALADVVARQLAADANLA